MKRKFKTRKIKKKYKALFLIIVVLILLIIILNFLSNLKILKQDALKTLSYSNNLEKRKIKKEITDIIAQIIKVDVNKPTTILKSMMHYETPKIEKEYYKIENNIEKNNPEPLVYIYNTHQTEEYKDKQNTVLTASHYLQEKLEENKIQSIVEEKSIKSTIEENNLKYSESYKASRINLEKIKNEYPSIKIFIDLHRDSVERTLSTAVIDDKTYAKVLFVIGKENNNYKQNLEYTTSINKKIVENYPKLTKGILEKEGLGVDGIYNQDIAPNVILIEVGGIENTIEEVKNTLDIISEIIKEKIYEE